MEPRVLRSRLVDRAMVEKEKDAMESLGNLKRKARHRQPETEPTQEDSQLIIPTLFNPEPGDPAWMNLVQPEGAAIGKPRTILTPLGRPKLNVTRAQQKVPRIATFQETQGIVPDSQPPHESPAQDSGDSEGAGSSHEQEDDLRDYLSDAERSESDVPVHEDDDGGEDDSPAKVIHDIFFKKGKEDQIQGRKRSKKGEPRQIIEEDHVASLFTHYKVHMAAFCKNKKGNIKQVIPAKVWLEVHAAYRKDYPHSNFQDYALKEHLRRAIIDIQAAEVGGEKAEIEEAQDQDEDIMAKLMSTQGAKERNVLRTRMGLCHQVSSGSGKTVDPSRPSTPQVTSDQPQDSPIPKPLTKSQQLKAAGDNMSDILSEVKGLKAQLVKPVDDSARRRLDEEKVEVLKARRRGQETQNVLAEIALLKEQKALGLLSEVEFMEACKEKFASRNA